MVADWPEAGPRDRARRVRVRRPDRDGPGRAPPQDRLPRRRAAAPAVVEAGSAGRPAARSTAADRADARAARTARRRGDAAQRPGPRPERGRGRRDGLPARRGPVRRGPGARAGREGAQPTPTRTAERTAAQFSQPTFTEKAPPAGGRPAPRAACRAAGARRRCSAPASTRSARSRADDAATGRRVGRTGPGARSRCSHPVRGSAGDVLGFWLGIAVVLRHPGSSWARSPSVTDGCTRPSPSVAGTAGVHAVDPAGAPDLGGRPGAGLLAPGRPAPGARAAAVRSVAGRAGGLRAGPRDRASPTTPPSQRPCRSSC